MWTKDTEVHWQQEVDAVMSGVKEWRLHHPRATFQEIEAALDERLAKMRARMLQDLALASAAATVDDGANGERPGCSRCGQPMESRGDQARTLTTNYNQPITLTRSYAYCPACEAGLFPLDEELKLLAGAFTPSVVEGIVRLGTWMPFVPVTQGLAYFCKVHVSEPTARRKTEQAGDAYVAVQTAQVDALEREEREPPRGPAVQPISVDGAMVPLLQKAWGEVKTVAIGVVGKPVLKKGEWHVQTDELSYFSRMTDHETFARLAPVETQRRGTATAGTVCAVNDGAEWEQKFVDYQRPDAVRILDWGHGAEHVGEVGRALFGMDPPAAKTWLAGQLRELKPGDPSTVRGDLRQLRDEVAAGEQRGV